MAGVRINREVSLFLELRCQCRVCGSSLYSEASGEQVGSPLVVKVSACAHCRRAEEVNGGNIHREGATS